MTAQFLTTPGGASMSHRGEGMSDCKHSRVRGFSLDDGSSAGIWVCAGCDLRFVPIAREIELESENARLQERNAYLEAKNESLQNMVADRLAETGQRDGEYS